MDKKRLFYEKNGYIVYQNLIPQYKIDKLLEIFNKFKISNSLFYSQSEHNWRLTKADLDAHNNLDTSIECFTELFWAPSLSKVGREILSSHEINNCLKNLTGEGDFVMWQNMLFDKSTGTIDHQDSYYLDTDPMGNLIAAWVALEDIKGGGGEFHVYPGSHKNNDNSWKNLNHSEFVDWSKTSTKKYNKKPLNIKKGDVVFWHPFLLHGSSSQKLKGYTRKSLTAHYHPKKYLRSNGKKEPENNKKIYVKKLKKQFCLARDFGYPISNRWSRRKIAVYSIKGLLIFLKNKGNIPKNLMNRLKNKSYIN